MFRADYLFKSRPLLQIFKNAGLLYRCLGTQSAVKLTAFSSKPSLKAEEAKRVNWQARVDLAAAFRGFEMMDFHESICNHLSLLAPAANGDGKVMLMIPYGLNWKEAEPELLVGVNENGEVAEGKDEVETSAWTIHLGIHKARPDAQCVFHLHLPYASALGMLKDLPFGMYHQVSCYFHNDFAYDRDYSGLSLDMDEGERIAKHVGNKRVLFMCNHGVTVMGNSVAEAFNDCYFLERACRIQTIAMSTGKELQELPEHVVKFTKEQYDAGREEYSRLFFESIKRILKKKDE